MVGFPLLLIPIAIYNIVAWLMPSVSPTDTPLVQVSLVSGQTWSIDLGDGLLALGLLLLLMEVVKGARPGSKYLTDHLLSLIVFGAAAAEFVMWKPFGNSTFFLLTLMALVEFFGGIALHARRRVVAVPVTATAKRPIDPVPTPPEVRDEPAPAAPSAASVAEPVLLDHPQPRPAPPPAAAHEPSPTVASPKLQPHDNPAASPETPRT